MLTLVALCDMNDTLSITLRAVPWDESVHLSRPFVLATVEQKLLLNRSQNGITEVRI